MNKRELYKNGPKITEIGLGTWQLGTKWGEPFNAEEVSARRLRGKASTRIGKRTVIISLFSCKI